MGASRGDTGGACEIVLVIFGVSKAGALTFEVVFGGVLVAFFKAVGLALDGVSVKATLAKALARLVSTSSRL